MSASPRRPAHNRPALIALVAVAAIACLGLGWWQWERFESASGTGQNLGYALQWPLFAGFAIFAYFRFVRLEREQESDPATARGPVHGAAPREIPAGILPQRPKAARDTDPAMDEYNRYLAALHADDIDDQIRRASHSTRDTERSGG
ncbi:SURF1 family protein [Nocardia bovistercoris]|uniref:transcriptional regulator n=1 Tax=Nocardia bovistercoris TaxID=2785916 RepID=UPI0038CD8645